MQAHALRRSRSYVSSKLKWAAGSGEYYNLVGTGSKNLPDEVMALDPETASA